MSGLMDTTAPVRAGEELDVAKLEPYLRQALERPTGEFSVEQFPGGHSNLTYLVRIGDLEMVLRRPPFGSKVKSAHDMGREYTILSHIHGHFRPAPKPYVFCEDESVIGAKFYAMERLEGTIIRVTRPEGFVLTPEIVRRTCEGVINTLADLHLMDWRAAGLDFLQKKEGSFIERQVHGWEKRWEASKTHETRHVEDVFKWCTERMPADTGASLIHNDYKFDNLILDTNDLSKVIGVLDWEMSTIGDPVFDLGVTLGYWMNPGEVGVSTSRTFFTQEPGTLTRLELADIYAKRTGFDIANLHYYFAFAVIKLAVVLQQIYYRYHHGLTKDERFAGMHTGVQALADRAAEIVEIGRI